MGPGGKLGIPFKIGKMLKNGDNSLLNKILKQGVELAVLLGRLPSKTQVEAFEEKVPKIPQGSVTALTWLA